MYPAETCTDGRVRVVSGDGLESREGRVEVCYRGVWGPSSMTGGPTEMQLSSVERWDTRHKVSLRGIEMYF